MNRFRQDKGARYQEYIRVKYHGRLPLECLVHNSSAGIAQPDCHVCEEGADEYCMLLEDRFLSHPALSICESCARELGLLW